jgi:hypothetical protein
VQTCGDEYLTVGGFLVRLEQEPCSVMMKVDAAMQPIDALVEGRQGFHNGTGLLGYVLATTED